MSVHAHSVICVNDWACVWVAERVCVCVCALDTVKIDDENWAVPYRTEPNRTMQWKSAKVRLSIMRCKLAIARNKVEPWDKNKQK